MTPPIQTSVAISFTNTSIIEGSLYDHKDHMDIELRIPNSADDSKVVCATALIGRVVGTSVKYTTSTTLKKDGIVSIGTPTSVPSNEVTYRDASGNSFEDGIGYSVRITVTIQDNGNTSLHHSNFTINSNTSKTYTYLHRDDGGDTFNTNDLSIVNPNEIEYGSNILLTLPMNYEISGDDKPTHFVLIFDEMDNYVGSINDTNDTEQAASYSSLQVYDDSNGNVYTLPTNTLDNDKTYVVTVTAIYADGYSTTETIPQPLHVIAAPVISSITAYGLGINKDGAGDPTISSVMNVYVDPSTDPVRILPVSNNVKFNLSQQDASGNPVIFYSATLPLSSDQQSDNTFLYTVLKDNLTKEEWTTTPPVQNSNGSYTYDVTMVIDYDVSHVTPNGVITKTSISKPATFTSDINQITSVNIVNAWVAATNVVGTGDRVVDYSDTTTAQGYDAAPEFGIVGYFNKHDFFGSGIVEGFFKDLDSTDTKFQFKLSVDGGDFQAVQTLFMMQDDAAKTDQQNTIDLFSNSTLTKLNGVYDNIPGTAGTPGSSQPILRFWIPASELTRLGAAVQGNSIKVSVALQPPAGQTTRPDATESGEVALLHKVKHYSMAFATDSEPRFDGSGINAYLTVPIDNEKVAANDLYFSQALLYSDSGSNYSNNADEDGKFDFVIENPGVRGTTTTFDYQVAYKVDDPNGGTITGPKITTYSIYLKDEPTADNFTVSNYEYFVFNDDSVSSFKFDIQFQDVGNTSIDGVMVYFNETSVYKVERSNGDSQTNITVTLTTTAASTSSVSDGIYISDIDGNVSTSMWSNFDAATINFKPYYTPKVNSTDDEPVVIEDPASHHILNIPVIDMPANVSLTGGVIESYNATYMSWDNDLAKYDERSWIRASLYLEENTTDQTGGIQNNSYFEIGLGNTPSTYTMDLSVKIASTVDSRVFYSKSVVLAFDSVSVDQSGMTVTTKRGSADVNLKAEYVDYTTSPPNASNLNVTAVQHIDNPNGYLNPYEEDIRVLNCTSAANAVQPPATINTYSIASDYDLADQIHQEIRMEAGISYTLQYGDAAASNENSMPLYLALNGPNTLYIVAKKPEITITGSCSVVSSGTYVGQTAVPMVINANGLKNEGLLSVVVVLVKENDYTNADDATDGTELVLAFESSNGRVKSYVVGNDADTATGSTDNLGAKETHVLTVDDIEGFSETVSTADFTLVTGNLEGNDQSVLYLPSDCEFANSSFIVVAIVSTRVGTDFHVNAVVPA